MHQPPRTYMVPAFPSSTLFPLSSSSQPPQLDLRSLIPNISSRFCLRLLCFCCAYELPAIENNTSQPIVLSPAPSSSIVGHCLKKKDPPNNHSSHPLPLFPLFYLPSSPPSFPQPFSPIQNPIPHLPPNLPPLTPPKSPLPTMT